MYQIAVGKAPVLEEVGGKGLSLMRMAGAGLPVPPSFILPVPSPGPGTLARRGGSGKRPRRG